MIENPRTADDYMPDDLRLVRAGCLELAMRFGDLLDDLVVVGGLVPTLLIDAVREEKSQREGLAIDWHVGTQDLDLGFALGLLEAERYKELSRRLRGSGFRPDKNERGNRTTHRWKHEAYDGLTIDFLIPPTPDAEKGGQIKNLEADFSAIVIPGLELAFRDTELVEVNGEILNGAKAVRHVPVCGPGAFVVLKALAWNRRKKEKDAYDLFYMMRNYGVGPKDVARRFRPFLLEKNRSAVEAMQILERDFLGTNSAGPADVSQFVYGARDDAIEADVRAFVAAFCDHARANEGAT